MIELKLGDCLQLMFEIPDNSVDMVFCDMPYGTTACKWDSVLDLDLLWVQYKRLIKADGVIALTAAQPFTTNLICSNKEWFKYCWYWHKNQGTNFFHAKRMPIRKIEEVLVFSTSNKAYKPQITSGHIPTQSAKGTSTGNIYHGNNIRNEQGGKTTRYPDNVLQFKCVSNYKRMHPSEKPIELIEYLIKTYTNAGDVVLDNCMGSGTTGVACKKLNRKFIGIELDDTYFETAKKRIENTEKTNWF